MTAIETEPFFNPEEHEIPLADSQVPTEETDRTPVSSGLIALNNTVDFQPIEASTDEAQPLETDISSNTDVSYKQKVTEIINSHAAMIYNLIESALGEKNTTQIDDVAQEVNIRIFKYFVNFRGDSEISTWIHRITINETLRFLKKRGTRNDRELSIQSITNEIADVSSTDQIEDLAANIDNHHKLNEALDTLSAMNRKIIELHSCGYSYFEIAKMLGLSSETATKLRAFRSRNKLLAKLKSDQESEDL